ncbi:MAG: HlyC/CorC family transporter [Rhizobiales bacterium]|nr:HlyC/CorC family transporter [Hyphomicrobiales bacterium]MBI3672992.1 HlyC/CorC family transporter [Hyphomicrobiales bacterium]
MAYLEIALIVVLIMLNGLLAMSELAVASSRAAKLRSLADQKVNGARRALALASDPGRFLSTVQIGITLIGILAGAFSGATLGGRLSSLLMTLGLPEHAAEPIGFGLVIGLVTYLSLIVGELVPKQIALRNPERIACLVAPAMTILAKVSAPLVWLLERSGRLVLAFLGQSRIKDDTVTDAEIHALIAEAESAGVLEPEERTMIAGVMRLGDRLVRTVMTPRADVEMIDVKETPAKIGRHMAESGHSRFIAYEGTPDNILGVIQAKDVAAALLRRRSPNIKQLVRNGPVIPDTLDALDVVNKLKESEVHFGLVYDEYGHFEGIVTTADILEAIVGVFRHDGREPELDIVERADGSLLVSGGTPIDRLSDRLGMALPPTRDYQTVAGFVLDRLGRIPAAGESFKEGGIHFEVVDLDGRRIDRVIVSRTAPATRRATI